MDDYAGGMTFAQEAARLARAAGDLPRQARAYIRMGSALRSQAKYAEARQYLEQALDLARKENLTKIEGSCLANLGIIVDLSGDSVASQSYFERFLELSRQAGDRIEESNALNNLLLHSAGRDHLSIESRAGLARTALAQHNLRRARAEVEPILEHLAKNSLESAAEPLRVHFICYQVLSAAGDPRSGEILQQAYVLMQERAAKLDENQRRTYLENVPVNRELASLIHAFG